MMANKIITVLLVGVAFSAGYIVGQKRAPAVSNIQQVAPPADEDLTNHVVIEKDGLTVRDSKEQVLYTVLNQNYKNNPLVFLEVASYSSDGRYALIVGMMRGNESYGIVDTQTGEYRTIISGIMDDITWAPRERVLIMARSISMTNSPSGLYLIDLRKINTLNSPPLQARNIDVDIGYANMHFSTVDFFPDGRQISFTYSDTSNNPKIATTSLNIFLESSSSNF
ncbi:MAG: hypothetical protein Greene041614_702 [Parcubacteria group bacterium Greene0416_14]|nr:MAG: hypothetical protein Greene041614_702 [Parcubacteria group bacterium Greene0416_14]TSD08142.1 MAG: hypothetical protein Greene07144_377 [Parcubacteria group bacterium Greene0714_4]